MAYECTQHERKLLDLLQRVTIARAYATGGSVQLDVYDHKRRLKDRATGGHDILHALYQAVNESDGNG